MLQKSYANNSSRGEIALASFFYTFLHFIVFKVLTVDLFLAYFQLCISYHVLQHNADGRSSRVEKRTLESGPSYDPSCTSGGKETAGNDNSIDKDNVKREVTVRLEEAARGDTSPVNNSSKIDSGSTGANQSERRIGAKRRRSGIVQRFRPDHSSSDPRHAQNFVLVNGAHNRDQHQTADHVDPYPTIRFDLSRDNATITRILKPTRFTTAKTNDVQDVSITFLVMRSYGVRTRLGSLPLELLIMIASSIECLQDLVIFSAVCPLWHTAYSKAKSTWTPKMPWLMLAEMHEDNPRCLCTVFDPAAKRQYQMGLPETFGRYYHGCGDGWVFTFGLDMEMHLFNPHTRAHLSLPPAQTLP